MLLLRSHDRVLDAVGCVGHVTKGRLDKVDFLTGSHTGEEKKRRWKRRKENTDESRHPFPLLAVDWFVIKGVFMHRRRFIGCEVKVSHRTTLMDDVDRP